MWEWAATKNRVFLYLLSKFAVPNQLLHQAKPSHLLYHLSSHHILSTNRWTKTWSELSDQLDWFSSKMRDIVKTSTNLSRARTWRLTFWCRVCSWSISMELLIRTALLHLTHVFGTCKALITFPALLASPDLLRLYDSIMHGEASLWGALNTRPWANRMIVTGHRQELGIFCPSLPQVSGMQKCLKLEVEIILPWLPRPAEREFTDYIPIGLWTTPMTARFCLLWQIITFINRTGDKDSPRLYRMMIRPSTGNDLSIILTSQLL